MVESYRKKLFVVKAALYTGCNQEELKEWLGDKVVFSGGLYIYTLEGCHRASIGDYIIQGVAGGKN